MKQMTFETGFFDLLKKLSPPKGAWTRRTTLITLNGQWFWLRPSRLKRPVICQRSWQRWVS
jgi:hypothetical protein